MWMAIPVPYGLGCKVRFENPPFLPLCKGGLGGILRNLNSLVGLLFLIIRGAVEIGFFDVDAGDGGDMVFNDQIVVVILTF